MHIRTLSCPGGVGDNSVSVEKNPSTDLVSLFALVLLINDSLNIRATN